MIKLLSGSRLQSIRQGYTSEDAITFAQRAHAIVLEPEETDDINPFLVPNEINAKGYLFYIVNVQQLFWRQP